MTFANRDSGSSEGVLAFIRREGVETPEHVEMQFELAGLGSRAAAAALDALILLALQALVGLGILVGSVWIDLSSALVAVIFLVSSFVALWGYFLYFEGRFAGQTPGKRLLGIRVISETGASLTWSAAAVRNLIRIVDMQPGLTYVVGALFVFFHPRARRLGDLVAGTMVVRDQPQEHRVAPTAVPAGAAPVPLGASGSTLSDDEFQLLERYVVRLDDLEADAAGRLSTHIAARFAERFPLRPESDETFLRQLHRDEYERRRHGLTGGRVAAGLRRGAAARFVAQKQARWDAFRRWAEQVEADGLSAIPAEDIVTFAARYREVAADMARAQTYGVPAETIAELTRMVTVGHNAIYRGRVRQRGARREGWRAVLRAPVRNAAWVGAAAIAFLIPAIGGYGAVRSNPALAQTILPAGIVARAEAGAQRTGEGRGYFEVPSPFMPIVATSIIRNNVQVALAAFALGVTAGIGTVVVLAFNGLFFGAVLALFANYGLTGYLLTFVAGHGVWEFTAIFVAGGAGLRIARAVVAPGDLPRREALVTGGREAIAMVGAAVVLLLGAGVIEGFVSASVLPWTVKAGVAAGSAVVLVVLASWSRRTPAERRSAQPVVA